MDKISWIDALQPNLLPLGRNQRKRKGKRILSLVRVALERMMKQYSGLRRSRVSTMMADSMHPPTLYAHTHTHTHTIYVYICPSLVAACRTCQKEQCICWSSSRHFSPREAKRENGVSRSIYIPCTVLQTLTLVVHFVTATVEPCFLVRGRPWLLL